MPPLEILLASQFKWNRPQELRASIRAAKLSAEAFHPDAACRRNAQVHVAAIDGEQSGLIVLAFADAGFHAGLERETIEKL